jgi:hypothetical protein
VRECVLCLSSSRQLRLGRSGADELASAGLAKVILAAQSDGHEGLRGSVEVYRGGLAGDERARIDRFRLDVDRVYYSQLSIVSEKGCYDM